MEIVGGDFTKIQYAAVDKVLTVGENTLVYHLDRDGNRDSFVSSESAKFVSGKYRERYTIPWVGRG